MPITTISSIQFATAFRLRPQQLAWFLGAGASASAGIPTGYAMITDFKKTLFCQLSGMRFREVDANDPLWIERINAFFSTRSELPPPNHASEYAVAFEAVYPSQKARRDYIEDAVKKGVPSIAHRVLASLITAKRVQCIFTTNFDTLVEFTAVLTDEMVEASERAHLTVAAIDNADRAQRCLSESAWPLLVKLHGDFKSAELKNTATELQSQDEKLRHVLTGACGRFGLVVVGYSGRDDSVMTALTDALKQNAPFPGGIYWVARDIPLLLPAVTEFLQAANDAGVNVHIVQCQTFDELAMDIVDGMTLPRVLEEHIFSLAPELPRAVPAVAVKRDVANFPVLRCSALPVLVMPTVARRVLIDNALTSPRVRELIKGAKVKAVAASVGKEIAAFGSDVDLLAAFSSVGGRIGGTISLDPVKDSWARGLIYDALTRALCRNRPLFAKMRRSGHAILVAQGPRDEEAIRATWRKEQLSVLKAAYSGALYGKVPAHNLSFFEGIQLRLDQAAGRWWCAFEPITYVDIPSSANADSADLVSSSSLGGRRGGDPVGDWRRERWARRYNAAWAQIIDAWAQLLIGDGAGEVCALGVASEDGLDAVFSLSPVTAWSRPGHQHDYFKRGRR